jgi:ribosomal subunit interface protein
VDIIFKSRRTDVQDRFRRHASAKLGRIEKLDHRAIRVDVEVTAERNPRQSDRRERVELTIQSRGPVIRAEAAADDRYAAFDRALAKLEARLRRLGDRRKDRQAATAAERATGPLPVVVADGAPGQAGTPDGMVVPPPAAPQPRRGRRAFPGFDGFGRRERNGRARKPVQPGPDTEAETDPEPPIPIQMEGDGPLVVREKFHTAMPMSIDQALLEMELVGHDFYLFRDDACGHPSVVYRRHGYHYGLIRLVEQQQPAAPRPGRSA